LFDTEAVNGFHTVANGLLKGDLSVQFSSTVAFVMFIFCWLSTHHKFLIKVDMALQDMVY